MKNSSETFEPSDQSHIQHLLGAIWIYPEIAHLEIVHLTLELLPTVSNFGLFQDTAP